jgi:hypothetical protein
MSKKVITKAVPTKAFETATVKIEAPKIYQVKQVAPVSYAVLVNGELCTKLGYPAQNVSDAFYYRNEKLAFEALALFQSAEG